MKQTKYLMHYVNEEENLSVTKQGCKYNNTMDFKIFCGSKNWKKYDII